MHNLKDTLLLLGGHVDISYLFTRVSGSFRWAHPKPRTSGVVWEATTTPPTAPTRCGLPVGWSSDAKDKDSSEDMNISRYINPYTTLHQDRPYHDDSTASRSLSEVKHRRARLVLRWGTTLESRVLFFFADFTPRTISFSTF